jgi:methanethiol S-methyltransferase
MADSGFWWILLAGVIYGLQHSWLASLQAKGFAERAFRTPGQIFYRFFFVIVSVISTAGYGALVILLPDTRIYLIPAPWVYLTLLVQLVSSLCLIASLLQTGAISFLGMTPFFQPQKTTTVSKLNTSGFYKWVRHPIYFFSCIILWLMPIMTWNILAFAISATIYTLIGSLFEERKLVAEFGQAYLDYKKKTPWIIPVKF